MWPGKWCYQSKYRNNGIVHWLCSNLFWQYHLQTGLENSFWRRQYYTSHITLGKRRWRTLDCQKLLWPDNINKKKIKLFKGHTDQITLCKNCIITSVHFCLINRNLLTFSRQEKADSRYFLTFFLHAEHIRSNITVGVLGSSLVIASWQETERAPRASKRASFPCEYKYYF